MQPADYDAWYATPRGRWIADREFALLWRLMDPEPGHSLLDVGCGTGYFSRCFGAVGLQVTGTDPDPAALAFARAQGGAAYVRADARDLPWPEASLDWVTAITSPLLRLVEWMMNRRARLSRIATGDQGVFVSRALFQVVGGFADIDLMEDVELSKRLRRRAQPCPIATPLVTSSRRWEHGSIVRTTLLMWRLRLAYAPGADPRALARRYR